MIILTIAAAGIIILLVGSCGYNARARTILQKRMEHASREPGTDILAGAAPVNIDRGRNRVCLLLHGFMSSPADYGRLPEALDGAGWDVRIPLHPGHGRDPRELRDISADDFLDAAERELLALKNRYGTVALGGFSMGGAIAVILSARHEPDAALLVNPFFRLPYHPKYVLPVRWWYRSLGPLLDYGIRPHGIPINRPEGRSQFVTYKVLPTPIFGEVFELADRAHRTDLPDIPILALLSEGDETASPRATKRFLQRSGSDRTRIETYDASNHVLLLDYDREAAIEATIRFLNSMADE
jgi:carboxylesterase